jgi:hypothetical protein
VRDADGLPLANQAVSLSIDILEADLLLFTETHELVTDEFGLVNTIIGNGVAEFGTLENLVGKKDLSYTLTGTINGTETSLGAGKLGAVPYAYYGADEDADPENELQDLQIDGSNLSLSNSLVEVDFSAFKSPWVGDSLGFSLNLDSASLASYSRNEHQINARFEVENGLQIFAMILANQDITSRKEINTETGEVTSLVGKSDPLGQQAYRETTNISGPEVIKQQWFELDDKVSLLRKNEFRGHGPLAVEGFGTIGNLSGPTVINLSQFINNNNSLPEATNLLSFQSANQVNIDHSAIDINSQGDYYQTDVFTNVVKETSATEECYTERMQVMLDPDDNPPRVSYIDFKMNKDGDIVHEGIGNTIGITTTADEIKECNNIPAGGTFEQRVKQNGETAINQGIDGSLRFNEVNGNNGVSSAGNLVFNNEDGDPVAASAVASSGAGILNAAGAGGSPPLSRNGNMTAFPNTQHFTAGGVQLSMGINSDFAGNISVYNNGSPNLNLGTLQGIPDAGSIVGYDQGAPKWYLYTQDGVSKLLIDMIQSTVLSPNHNEDLAYGVLAGPEQAAYERGTATLVDGEVFVSCADHFAGIADPNSMTVTVTPLSAESLGLAIVEKSGQGFKVKELYKGKGNYSFDYMVMCKRSDVTYKLKPELPRADNSMKEISDQARMSYLKAKNAIK